MGENRERNFRIPKILLLSVLILLSCSGDRHFAPSSQPVPIAKTSKKIDLSKAVKSYKAPKELTFHEAKSKPSLFRYNEGNIFDQGFSESSVWIHCRIQNSSKNGKWYVSLQNNRLNFVDFYWVRERGTIHKKTGDHFPLSKNARTSFPYFSFQMHKGETANLWIRIQSDSRITFPILLMSSEVFGAYTKTKAIRAFSIVILMVLYLFCQISFNRNIPNLLKFCLCLAMVSGSGFLLFLYEDGFRYFFTNQPEIRNQAPFIFLLVFAFFFTLFLREYLAIPELSKALNGIFFILLILYPFEIMMLFSPIPNHINAFVRSFSILALYTVTIVAVVFNVRKKRYWTLLILSPWGLFFLGLIVEILMYLHWIEYKMEIQDQYLLGFSLEFIFVFISSFYRARSIQKERLQFEEKLESIRNELRNQNNNSNEEPRSETDAYWSRYDQRVQNLDRHALAKEIVRIFEENQPYLEDDYDLADLSRSLGIRQDQTSAILNNELKTGFNSFLNGFRLRYSRMLIDKYGSNANLLQIALESGFGSRSAFHRAFKKEYSISPQDYRSKILKKNVANHDARRL